MTGNRSNRTFIGARGLTKRRIMRPERHCVQSPWARKPRPAGAGGGRLLRWPTLEGGLQHGAGQARARQGRVARGEGGLGRYPRSPKYRLREQHLAGVGGEPAPVETVLGSDEGGDG